MLVRCGASQTMEADLLHYLTDNEGNMNEPGRKVVLVIADLVQPIIMSKH